MNQPYGEHMNTASSHPDAVIMTPDEFHASFDGLVQYEAYRLELLDWYDTPGIHERMQCFLAGESQDLAYRAEWDEFIAGVRQVGGTMSRVHVVAEPLTDYLRYELDFYRLSVVAGEDIRILSQADAAGLDLPDFDYWLFDECAVVMIYDESARFLRAEKVSSPAFLADCRRWRDIAMAHAMSLADYYSRRPA
jgi:hypothetical protein